MVEAAWNWANIFLWEQPITKFSCQIWKKPIIAWTAFDGHRPSAWRWGISSTRWTWRTAVPWRPPCSKSTWRCARTCWADRRRWRGRQARSAHRTRRSSASSRGGRRAAVIPDRTSYASRRRTETKHKSQERHLQGDVEGHSYNQFYRPLTWVGWFSSQRWERGQRRKLGEHKGFYRCAAWSD